MFTRNFQKLPQTIQNFLTELKQKIKPQEIILFGSRARGSHRDNSDFDIAIKGCTDSVAWTKALVSLENDNYTLYKIDLVRFEDLNDDYKNNINKEGVVLYE